jgi:hypothetical protein
MLKRYLEESLSAHATLVVETKHGKSRFMSRCHGAWAALAACIGMLGVLQSGRTVAASGSDGMAVIFGGVLCSLVLSRCYWNLRLMPETTAGEMRRLYRRDSRAVYLLLFCLIGAHEINCLLIGASVTGTAGDLQGYVAGGVGALVLIRLSGFCCVKFLSSTARG